MMRAPRVLGVMTRAPGGGCGAWFYGRNVNGIGQKTCTSLYRLNIDDHGSSVTLGSLCEDDRAKAAFPIRESVHAVCSATGAAGWPGGGSLEAIEKGVHTFRLSSLKVVVTGSALLLAGATSAFAAPDITYKGAHAWASPSTTINIADGACDGKAAQAQYIRSGSGSTYKLTEDNGCGSSRSTPAGGTVLQVKACIVYTFDGDDCSGWKS